VILVIGAMLVALLGLSACDPGPECIKDHTEITYTTVIGPNGSVSLQPTFTDVCDEYAKETAKP
jgi:hypothetical protein